MAFQKKFGSFQRDRNQRVISVGNKIQTQDATATPQKSPLVVSSTEIDIAVPENAFAMYIFVSGNFDIIFSEITGMARNCKLPAGSDHKDIPLGRTHHVYVKLAGATADSEISFYFKTI